MKRLSATIIAIVDDDPSVLDAVGNLLQASGYLIEAFASAEAFLQRQTQVPFACLVSDIGLPGMNGFDLQTEMGLRSPRMPVILVTGREEYAAGGPLAPNNRGLFRKPFDAEKLVAAVAGATKATA